MSSSIFLLSLLALAGAVFLYNRNGKQTAPEQADTEQATQSIAARLGSLLNSFRFWQKEQDLESSEAFKQWLVAVEPPQVPIQELKGWLATLDSQEGQILTKRTRSFADELNFNLSWVTEEQLAQNPQLKQALSEAVTFYCIADLKASQVASEIKAFVTFERWQKNPNSRELRKFSQQLLARLMDEELIPQAPSDLFLASEVERQEHAVAVIHEAAKSKPEAFNVILKDVVLSLEPAAQQPAPSPVPVAVPA